MSAKPLKLRRYTQAVLAEKPALLITWHRDGERRWVNGVLVKEPKQ